MAWAEVRVRPGRALTLGGGILAAAVCFALLSSESGASSARVTATIRHNFRAAYDILIRPRRAATAFERQRGVVDDGFLSGLFGGITMRQYGEIRSLPAVSLAAPVANVGWFVYQQTVLVPFPRSVSRNKPEVFRVKLSWDVHHGLSRYPGATLYLYWSPGTIRFLASGSRFQPAPIGRQTVGNGRRVLAVCRGFSRSTPPLASGAGPSSGATGIAGVSADPYTEADQPNFDCAARLVTYQGRSVTVNEPNQMDAEPSGHVGAEVTFDIPVLVAGIDPRAEDSLVGLRGAMRSGTYLGARAGLSAPGDVPGTSRLSSECADYTRSQRPCDVRSYPVIASTRTYLDEAAELTVQRLSVPVGTNLASQLASSRSAYSFITHLRGRTVARMSASPTTAWREALGHFTSDLGFDSIDGSGFSLDYWRPSATTDHVIPNATIVPATVRNNPNVWSDSAQVANFSLAPPGTADTWYRHLTSYGATGAPRMIDGRFTGVTPLPTLVGTFDPARLRGFSPLSRVPLQSFYPPTVTGANTRSRQGLDDTALGPTSNIAGYLTQPPLLLTTLKGAIALENGEGDVGLVRRGVRAGAYRGTSPNAPISTIQVRVKGVTGPNGSSLTRIDRVARQIAQRTGLTVDITAGSSPTSERIALAAGKFGEPRMLVDQRWTKKDVAVSITRALHSRDLALLLLTLLVCGLSIASATSAAVRARRREIATLRALGWPRRAVLTLVIVEVALVGLIAGVAGCALAVLLVAIGALAVATVWLALVIPVAVATAVAAGLVPAWGAAQAAPRDALRDPVRAGGHTLRARTVGALALANVVRVPGRSFIALATMTLGIGGLAFIVAIDLAFQDRVTGNLLGGVVSSRVRGVDVTSAAIIALLGAASLVSVVYAGRRERSIELATLRAIGWTERTIVWMTTDEGAMLGVAGSFLGAVLGAGIAAGAGAGAGTALLAAVIGLAAGCLLTFLGCLAVTAIKSDTHLTLE